MCITYSDMKLTMSKSFVHTNPLNPHHNSYQVNKIVITSVLDEETKAQEGKVSCPRSHSYLVEPGF